MNARSAARPFGVDASVSWVCGLEDGGSSTRSHHALVSIAVAHARRAAFEAGFFDQRFASAATSDFKNSASNFRGS